MTRQCAARFINQDIISTIVIEANNIILQINAEDDVLEDEAGFHPTKVRNEIAGTNIIRNPHIKHYRLPF